MDYKDDTEILFTFISETKDHLNEIEYGILKLENDPENIDAELIHSMFRAAHSIKAGANLLELKNIEILSNALENIFQKLRLEKLVLNSEMVTVFLQAVDMIVELADHPKIGDLANISSLVDSLQEILDQ